MNLINKKYKSIDEKFRLIEILRQENIGISSFNYLRSLLLLTDLTPNSKVTIRDLLYLQEFSESDAYRDIVSKQSNIYDIQKKIAQLQKIIDIKKEEQELIVNSITIDESKISDRSYIEKELLYAKYYRQEFKKFTQRKVNKFCGFPLSKSYSEENWHNLLVWKEFPLHKFTTLYGKGFINVAKYYAAFDIILETEYKEKFLSELNGNYEYSEENKNKMNDWIFSINIKNCEVESVRDTYDNGDYSDDEEGVMSALRNRDGDIFGF